MALPSLLQGCTRLNRCFEVAGIFERGDGVPRDLSRAMALLEQGCRQGDTYCCRRLGEFYEFGGGAPADPARAEEAYRRGCEATGLGCAERARILEAGRGVRQDLPEARRLLTAVCERRGHYVRWARPSRETASESHPQSAVGPCLRAARMEREGVGGPASPAAAARHTRLACETGFQGACTSPTGRPAVASTPSPEVDAMVEAFRGASVAAPTGRADSLPRDLPAISVERFRLRNGLEVVMSPGGSERLARVQVTYPTGANGAPEGRHEAAHFAEHVSYHPTSRNPAGLLAATEALGATEYNGHTFAEGMTFHLEVPASALEGALALEADRMGASLDRVSEAAFENERRIITREWVTRHRDDPPAVALRAFGQRDARFLSPGSAPDEFAALTLADVRRYARDWHVPSNAQVTVVGGFDPTAARASIERYFGPIPAGDPPPRPRRAQVGPLDGESVVRVVAPAPSAETSLIVVWPLPPRYDEGGVELRLLPRLLATAAPVTLPRSVVRSIHFDIATNGDLTYLYFVARIAPGRSPEEALLRLDVALDEFRDMLPFEGLYTGPVGDLIRDVEEEAWSLSQRATRIALRPDPQDPGGFREEVRRLRAVAPPTFRALCERWFSPHRRLIVHDAPRGAR